MSTKKNPAAVALGQKGGLTRAQSLTKAERIAIAKKANKARTTFGGWPKGKPRGPRKAVK